MSLRAMAGRLMDWLRSERFVRRQVQWQLFVIRVYKPTKRHFERQYGDQQVSARIYHQDQNDETDPDGQEEVEGEDEQQQQQQDRRLEYDRDKDRIVARDCSHGWGFASLPVGLRAYDIISSTVLGWVFLKFLFPNAFAHLYRFIYLSLYGLYGLIVRQSDEHHEDQLPLSCFNFGRLVVHYELCDEVFGFLLASFHVLWRLAQLALNRPHQLNAVLFILQPRVDIERFIAKLNHTSTTSHHDHNENQNQNQNQNQSVLGYLLELPSPAAGSLSGHERLLRDIMCFRVPYGRADWRDFTNRQRVLYRLRPNRSLEAHDRLVAHLARITVRACIIMGLLALTFGVYLVTVVVFNQRRYVVNYPGCNANMSHLFRVGKLSRWSAYPATRLGHAMAAAIFDAIENFWLWFESGVVIFWALMFVMYLNDDLVEHWRHLDPRLKGLLGKIRRVYPGYSICNQQNYYEPKFALATELADEIYQLQVELSDFFTQIQRVDLFVSDIITHATFIWLTVFGTLSFKAAENYSHTHNLEFVLVLFCATIIVFIGYSSVCQSLMQLQRRCRRSYLTICSLMAHDQSRLKARFIQIINYYTCANRTCYTMFQSYPFTNNNFLSVIGWSITAFLILDSVYYKRIG